MSKIDKNDISPVKWESAHEWVKDAVLMAAATWETDPRAQIDMHHYPAADEKTRALGLCFAEYLPDGRMLVWFAGYPKREVIGWPKPVLRKANELRGVMADELEEPSAGDVTELSAPKRNTPSLTQNPSLLPVLADMLLDVAKDLESLRHPEDEDPSEDDRAVLAASISVGRGCGMKPRVDIHLNWSAFKYLFTGSRVTVSPCGKHFRMTDDRGVCVLTYTAVKSGPCPCETTPNEETTL